MAKELAEGLKPCPFCGGKATMSVTQDDMYVIECDYCHSRSHTWKEEAVACMIWNGRKIPEDLIADFIALIWAGGTIGLWLANLCLLLANLYGSKVDVYRNGYLNGFADGIKHAYSMRINQGKKR